MAQKNPKAGELLSKREIEVAALVALGPENKIIAERIDVSDHTVKFFVNRVIRKLGARNRTHAAVLWVRRTERLGAPDQIFGANAF